MNKHNSVDLNDLSQEVQQHGTIVDFSKSVTESWVILPEIERSIKSKVEKAGLPLKDWNVQIKYGVKTGYNDAFVISTDKRNEILTNCRTEDERERTDKLIVPILRGRDIKKNGYVWANLWLINTHNGIKGIKDRIHIEDYPTLKKHLDGFWCKISKRADKGDTPYNLRNCVYLDDFSNPKIIYPDITQKLCFILDEKGYYLGNTAYFLSSESHETLRYINVILNTKLIDWYYRTISVQLGESALRLFSIYVLNIPIPLSGLDKDFSLFEDVEREVCLLYGLTEDEIQYIMKL